MTLPNNSAFNNEKETPRDHAWLFWMFAALFACFILCAAIIFCGLAVRTIQNNLRNEKEIPEVNFPTGNLPDVSPEVEADPAWKLLIDEEFNDNQNEWNVGPYQNDSLTLDRTIENGVYLWEYQSKGGWNFWGFPDSIPSARDFIATVEIKHILGNPLEGFGIILRAFNEEYYLLEINENGYIYFWIHTNNKYDILMEHTTSVLGNGQPNQIMVKAIGENFTFYVNGTLAGEINDDRLKSGFVGVFASTSGQPGDIPAPAPIYMPAAQEAHPSRYEMDNFKVWIPTSDAGELGALTPAKGRIVFVSDQHGNPEIHTINADGTDPARLTNNGADDLSPKWSFDGTKIAFVSTRDGNPEIYTMNSDGTEITRITNNAADDLDPAWSPDGAQIIFSSNRDENYEIYIHDLKAETVERITDNAAEDRYPDWSSKGETILYQSEQYGVAALYTLELSTREDTRITPRLSPYGHSNADLSTSGSSIVYTTGNTENQTGIMIYHLDTKKSMDVVTASVNQSIKSVSNLFPTWSGDDKQIAFVSSRDKQPDIYIISSDGKSIFRVTDTESSEWDLDWTGNLP
jgi:hypothetical protein